MRKATKNDRKRFIDIMSESFDTNPSVNWTVKQDNKRQKRYRLLAGFVFNQALRRDAIYFSSDDEGIIIFYKYNDFKTFFIEIFEKLLLTLRVISIERVGGIMKREKYIQSKRPADGEYIYCWFFGVSKIARGKGAAVELKDKIFAEADRLKLPVYIETTIPINMRIYNRYGFDIYHEWEVKEKGLTYWMMKREVK